MISLVIILYKIYWLMTFKIKDYCFVCWISIFRLIKGTIFYLEKIKETHNLISSKLKNRISYFILRIKTSVIDYWLLVSHLNIPYSYVIEKYFIIFSKIKEIAYFYIKINYAHILENYILVFNKFKYIRSLQFNLWILIRISYDYDIFEQNITKTIKI